MPAHLLLAASTVSPSTLTTDRIVATAAVVVALAGAIVGGLAFARPTGRNRRSTIALVAGLAGMVVGGLVLATADGGPGTGTGNGVVGGYAALGFGLIATVLGALATSRSRRTT